MLAELLPWLQLGIIGAVAGLLAGYLGIGGGLVLVPALSWWLSVQLADGLALPVVHMAVATSLATMLVTSLSSVIAHQRHAAIDWGTVRRLAPGLVAGAAAGALLAAAMSTGGLALVFGVFAACAGLQLVLGRSPQGQRALPGRLGSSMVAASIGTVSAMVGVGGGSMTAPWLMWHGVSAQRSIATAAACGYPIAVTGTLAFIWLGAAPAAESAGMLGYVYLPAFAGVAVASALAAPLGATLVHLSAPGMVRRGFGVFLLLVAWRMFNALS